jgi:hypothetical protein
MQSEETVLDKTEIRKIRLFGHVMRIPEERWPAKIHPWIPAGRRKRDDLGGHGWTASQRQRRERNGVRRRTGKRI